MLSTTAVLRVARVLQAEREQIGEELCAVAGDVLLAQAPDNLRGGRP
jgi:hypothetical protein